MLKYVTPIPHPPKIRSSRFSPSIFLSISLDQINGCPPTGCCGGASPGRWRSPAIVWTRTLLRAPDHRPPRDHSLAQLGGHQPAWFSSPGLTHINCLRSMGGSRAPPFYSARVQKGGSRPPCFSAFRHTIMFPHICPHPPFLFAQLPQIPPTSIPVVPRRSARFLPVLQARPRPRGGDHQTRAAREEARQPAGDGGPHAARPAAGPMHPPHPPDALVHAGIISLAI